MNTVTINASDYPVIAIAARGSSPFAEELFGSLRDRFDAAVTAVDVRHDGRTSWSQQPAGAVAGAMAAPRQRRIEAALAPAVADGRRPVAAYITNLHLTRGSEAGLIDELALLSSVVGSGDAGFALMQAEQFTDESQFNERFVSRQAGLIIADRPESVARIVGPGDLVAPADTDCEVTIGLVGPVPRGYTVIVRRRHGAASAW